MHLKELKQMSPADLILFADKKGVENASNKRKQDIMCLLIYNRIQKRPYKAEKLKEHS